MTTADDPDRDRRAAAEAIRAFYAGGKAPLPDGVEPHTLDGLLAAWHELPGDALLHEYLGMTWDEYRAPFDAPERNDT